ncbi:MAG: DNA replication/repair protein RecF [Pseudobdellovibrionaceae bacterium]
MTFVSDITLRNFRSYTEACLNGLASSFVVLTGANGAGKTNILEAVSLLSPGKGMRSADSQDFQNRSFSDPFWSVFSVTQTQYGSIRIGTGRDSQKERRSVHIQGEIVKSQTMLSDYLTCLWLTPQMDRLFIDAASSRRKFFDRMVFHFDPGHAGRMTRYENAMAQRSRLLKEGQNSPAWLDALELQMAQSGVAVAAARVMFTERLQAVCRTRENAAFPVAQLALSGQLEHLIHEGRSALALEDEFKAHLQSSRSEDAVYGGAARGPHKSDFLVTYAAKNMPASQCSTGEQKALLIGLVLAHADLIRMERGAPPILLLDEIAAHLDEVRREDLYKLLGQIGGQVWMSGTDLYLFEKVRGEASFFEVKNGQILSLNHA